MIPVWLRGGALGVWPGGPQPDGGPVRGHGQEGQAAPPVKVELYFL
jgi:hypothetical protein